MCLGSRVRETCGLVCQGSVGSCGLEVEAFLGNAWLGPVGQLWLSVARMVERGESGWG